MTFTETDFLAFARRKSSFAFGERDFPCRRGARRAVTAGASLKAGWSRSPALLPQQQGGIEQAPA